MHYGHKSFLIDYEWLPLFVGFQALDSPNDLGISTWMQSWPQGVLFLPQWLLEISHEKHLRKIEHHQGLAHHLELALDRELDLGHHLVHHHHQ